MFCIVIDHGVYDQSHIVNSVITLLCTSWGGPYPLEINLEHLTMCVDMLKVILHDPYEATCIPLPS